MLYLYIEVQTEHKVEQSETIDLLQIDCLFLHVH